MLRLLRTCAYRNLLNHSKARLQQTRLLNSDSAAYDGDGKTTVKLIDDQDGMNFVSTYSSLGFRITGNLFVTGSMLMFPTNVFAWNVKRGIDITEESLLIFDIIVPKVKIVVIGYGTNGEPYDVTLPLKLKKRGISCEILPTPNAVSTYNYLANDAVRVAGAFVPILAPEGPQTTSDNLNILDSDFSEPRDWLEPKTESIYERVKYVKLSRADKDKKNFDD